MCDGLTHARQDPALGIAPVFTALPRRKPGERPKLDVRQTFNGAEIQWRGPDALGPSDQSVLLVLLALGAVQNLRVSANSNTETARALRAGLDIEGDVENETFVGVEATWRELIQALGLKGRGGSTRDQVRRSVQRLADVGVWVTVGGITIRSRLLSWHVGDENRVTIALNWRLSRAICGGHYSRVSLAERRQLRSDAAQLLHSWLSSCLRPGHTRRFHIGTLVERVWFGQGKGSTLRTRQSVLKIALRDIGQLPGWTVELEQLTATIGRGRHISDASASGRRRHFPPKPSAGAGLRRTDAAGP